MTFCTITPTRGDRPEFLDFCKHQISRMHVKPDHSYFIDYPPVDGNKDLVARVQKGIEMAAADGFHYAFIIEEDDYYPDTYFSYMNFAAEFMGIESTIYYHLGNNGFQYEKHPNRASLFTTGFKLPALSGFDFRTVRGVFLDIALWNFANRHNKAKFFMSPGPIGVKHGIGVTGGIGHRQRIYKKFDKDWSYLANNVDSEAISFYKDMAKKLNNG